MCFTTLIEDAIGGDQRAWSRLFKIAEPVILRAINQKLLFKKTHIVDDIVQIINLKIFIGIARFNNGKSFESWVYIITINHCIDLYRNGEFKTFVRYDTDLCDVKGTVCTSFQFSNDILKALFVLEPKYRSLIYDKYWLGLKQVELAEKYKLPIGTVSHRIYAGILKLRSYMQNADLNYSDLLIY